MLATSSIYLCIIIVLRVAITTRIRRRIIPVLFYRHIPKYSVFLVFWVACIHMNAAAQQSPQGTADLADSTLVMVGSIPSQFYLQVNRKLEAADNQLTKKTVQYLRRFERQQERIQRKLQKLDPQALAAVPQATYNSLMQRVKAKSGVVGKLISTPYNSYVDSLGTSLAFIRQVGVMGDKAGVPLQSLDRLKGDLDVSQQVQTFIAERKSQLQAILSKYARIPGGLKSGYERLSKTAYYYSEQVKQYKETLHDRQAMEQKAMEVLDRIPAFEKFWQKNSLLAQLFPMPAGLGTVQGLAGLQSVGQVRQMIAQQLGTSVNSSGNLSSYVQQQFSEAQNSLNHLKDQVARLGGTSGSGSMEMPDFRPNSQKTRAFWKRLEYGVNVQHTPATALLPFISDFGITVGYRGSDRLTFGIGGSYKLGMGKDFSHIHFSSQGVGLRAWLDAEAHGSIWVTGGWEYNYYEAFSKLSDLKNIQQWQQNALVGIKKKYRMGKKDGSMTLLYDLLAPREVPRTSGLKFRIGYNF